ncbi:hypothetical protein NM208_g16251 [Fusarium decemcellulare]|uniref:Uncharacterized protein n=1 Tax=Fusarium decemcellulare TaxID=57161 RepID=A0ACC1REW8_9HYPO|nr:hypothetical protein NM208_g16251 [Fusarium decemcellulare]
MATEIKGHIANVVVCCLSPAAAQPQSPIWSTRVYLGAKDTSAIVAPPSRDIYRGFRGRHLLHLAESPDRVATELGPTVKMQGVFLSPVQHIYLLGELWSHTPKGAGYPASLADGMSLPGGPFQWVRLPNFRCLQGALHPAFFSGEAKILWKAGPTVAPSRPVEHRGPEPGTSAGSGIRGAGKLLRLISTVETKRQR